MIPLILQVGYSTVSLNSCSLRVNFQLDHCLITPNGAYKFIELGPLYLNLDQISTREFSTVLALPSRVRAPTDARFSSLFVGNFFTTYSVSCSNNVAIVVIKSHDLIFVSYSVSDVTRYCYNLLFVFHKNKTQVHFIFEGLHAILVPIGGQLRLMQANLI